MQLCLLPQITFIVCSYISISHIQLETLPLFPFQEQIPAAPREHVGPISNKYSLCKFLGHCGPCPKVLKVNNSTILNSGNPVL